MIKQIKKSFNFNSKLVKTKFALKVVYCKGSNNLYFNTAFITYRIQGIMSE